MSDFIKYKIQVRGRVQGVGFRPFVHRLALQLGLAGHVRNESNAVAIEVEGENQICDEFVHRLKKEIPFPGQIEELSIRKIKTQMHLKQFTILESSQDGMEIGLLTPPDLAMCKNCLNEMLDPHDGRYFYPFINCMHCGPRYSILESTPYDRVSTTMNDFMMCASCQAEYNDLGSRRYHAQPNCCPHCGPRIFSSLEGGSVEDNLEVLLSASRALQEGKIVAVKGIGGFHLMVDAQNPEAITRLRERKQRGNKPLALMCLEPQVIADWVAPSPDEIRALYHPSAPIVLLKKQQMQNSALQAIAPDNAYLGVMLAYSPLHYLLLKVFSGPVVATSGNLKDEPICIANQEAVDRLKHIADHFVFHNRRIKRPMDDSIVQVISGRWHTLRVGRGMAPLVLPGAQEQVSRVGVGGHLKNTIALSLPRHIMLSQHHGDLEHALAFEAFTESYAHLKSYLQFEAKEFVTDLHPHYASTLWAEDESQKLQIPLRVVQHHQAHFAAVIAEHSLQKSNLIGVIWDGAGYIDANHILGGEFLYYQPNAEPLKKMVTLARLSNFPLLLGSRGYHEPRIAAYGLVSQLTDGLVREEAFTRVQQMFEDSDLLALQKTLTADPKHLIQTNSVGRLFDVVAALIGLRSVQGFEADAACALECKARQVVEPKSLQAYPISLNAKGDSIDLSQIIEQITMDLIAGVLPDKIAYKFHLSLVRIIEVVLTHWPKDKEFSGVCFSGGCFQNQLLLELIEDSAVLRKYKLYFGEKVPMNDAGISFGQLAFVQGDM